MSKNSDVYAPAKSSYVEAAARAEAMIQGQRQGQPIHDNSMISESYTTANSVSETVILTQRDDISQLGWDNYQSPMYEDRKGDTVEEPLVLCWDEQLEAGVQSIRPAEWLIDQPTISKGQLTTFESAVVPNEEEDTASMSNGFDDDTNKIQSVHDSQALSLLLVRSEKRLDRCHMSLAKNSSLEQENIASDLSRISFLSTTCHNHLDHLRSVKNILKDKAVDPEDSRKLDKLIQEWSAFLKNCDQRLSTLQGFSNAQQQATDIALEVEKLSQELEQTATGEMKDFATLEKHTNTLKTYDASLKTWLNEIDALIQDVIVVAANDFYTDHTEQCTSSLSALKDKTKSVEHWNTELLNKLKDLSQNCKDVQTMCSECEHILTEEKHHLRCSKLTMGLVSTSDIEAVIEDLQDVGNKLKNISPMSESLSENLDACNNRLKKAGQLFNSVSSHLSDEQKDTIECQLATLTDETTNLKFDCHQFIRELQVRNRHSQESIEVIPPQSAALSVAPSQPFISVFQTRLRHSVPYQFAVVIILGVFCFILKQTYPYLFDSAFLLSPELRNSRGSPL